MQQTVTMNAKIKLTHHMDTKYEAHQDEEDVSKAYDRMAAMSTTNDAQHQLMHGQSIPRAFFMNKALPEAKEETKRGLQFLYKLFCNDRSSFLTGLGLAVFQ